jgi:fluoroquinolone resistance protein
MDVDGAGFQDTLFEGCRLEGVQFARCRRLLLSFSFDRCMLRLASFVSLDIRGTRFEGCELYEADFSESDLRGAVFADCDLLRAVFMHTNLEKADFRTACNYSFSPDLNRIRNARFCLPELTGLLDGYGIRVE